MGLKRDFYEGSWLFGRWESREMIQRYTRSVSFSDSFRIVKQARYSSVILNGAKTIALLIFQQLQ